MKKLSIATLYAIIAFCVVSYISVMTSLFSTIGSAQRPVTNIGFPFKYYYQFWLSGNPGPNCGWNFIHFVLDFFTVWALTLFVYFFIKRNKLK